MQRVRVLRLNCNDLPVERFRLTKSPGPVVVDGGSKYFGVGHYATQAENPPRIAIASRTCMASNEVAQRLMNARDDVVPRARLVLPKQTGGRVPWAIVAV